jgi:hypothetical protein
MTSTLRLGRVAGIDIGAHWSWLLVFGLIVWSLAAGVFPSTNPGLSDATYVAMAAAAALLFFASIVLHELGHALQARRDGIAIEGITLWVFGGVAHLRSEPPSARAELHGGGRPGGLAGDRRYLRARRDRASRAGGRRWRGVLAGADEPLSGGVQPPARLPPRRRSCVARSAVGTAPGFHVGDAHGDRMGTRLSVSC